MIRTIAFVLSAALLVTAFTVAPAAAQTTGGSTIGPGGDPPTPRNNVSGGALLNRAPGNWIKNALAGGNEITEQADDTPSLTTTILQQLAEAFFALINQLLLAIQAALNPLNQAPTASFTATPTTVAVNVAVSFDASASTDPNGDTLSYAWDFGDNTTGTQKTTTHAYTGTGTYTVKLTVTDGKGGSNSTTKQITVTAAANTPPVALFAWSPASPNVGQAVTFNGSLSSDAEDTVLIYSWDFGDGATSNSAVVEHTYTAAKTYTVTLTVTDTKGAAGTRTLQVPVGAGS